MSLESTLRQYNQGSADSGAITSALTRYNTAGLTADELAAGLAQFGDWHRGRFGTGFTQYSSVDSIAQGAIQNALNARATGGTSGASEGAGAIGGAADIINNPDAASARASGAAAGAETFRAGQLDQNAADLPGQTSALVERFGLTPRQVQTGLNAYFAKNGGSMQDMPWWGEEATARAVLTGLGETDQKYAELVSRLDPALEASQNASARERETARQVGGPDYFSIVGALGFAAVLGGAALGGAFGAVGGSAAAEGVGTGLIDAGTGALATDAGTAAATGLTTASNTGGAFVGSNGLLGGTGNAIADAALNGGVRGLATSTLTGGDPLRGGVGGLISGGLTSALPDLGSNVLNNAAQGAVSGGVGAAVNGGDVLTGALAGGAAGGTGTLVREAIPTDIAGNTLTNAAAGAAAGGVGAAITGGDVATGILRGGVTGGATGAATDLGADPILAGASGTLAGGLINNPSPDAGTPAATQQTTSNVVAGDLGFGIVLPQFQNVTRRDMQWGTRLNP